MGADIEEMQLEVLKNSGLLSEFVRNTGGNWNQEDLDGLLSRIKEQNITVPLERIGAILESERVAYAQKLLEKKDEGETAVNFDELGLRRKREFLEVEIKRRMR